MATCDATGVLWGQQRADEVGDPKDPSSPEPEDCCAHVAMATTSPLSPGLDYSVCAAGEPPAIRLSPELYDA